MLTHAEVDIAPGKVIYARTRCGADDSDALDDRWRGRSGQIGGAPGHVGNEVSKLLEHGRRVLARGGIDPVHAVDQARYQIRGELALPGHVPGCGGLLID